LLTVAVSAVVIELVSTALGVGELENGVGVVKLAELLLILLAAVIDHLQLELPVPAGVLFLELADGDLLSADRLGDFRGFERIGDLDRLAAELDDRVDVPAELGDALSRAALR